MTGFRRCLAAVATVLVFLSAVASADEKDYEIRLLRAKVRMLELQITKLKTEIAALKAEAREVAARPADAPEANGGPPAENTEPKTVAVPKPPDKIPGKVAVMDTTVDRIPGKMPGKVPGRVVGGVATTAPAKTTDAPGKDSAVKTSNGKKTGGETKEDKKPVGLTPFGMWERLTVQLADASTQGTEINKQKNMKRVLNNFTAKLNGKPFYAPVTVLDVSRAARGVFLVRIDVANRPISAQPTKTRPSEAYKQKPRRPRVGYVAPNTPSAKIVATLKVMMQERQAADIKKGQTVMLSGVGQIRFGVYGIDAGPQPLLMQAYRYKNSRGATETRYVYYSGRMVKVHANDVTLRTIGWGGRWQMPN